MSCFQASIIKTYTCIRKHQGSSASLSRSRKCHVAIQTWPSFRSSSLQLLAREILCHQASKLPFLPVQKYRRLVPIGSFGDEAKSVGDGEDSGQKNLKTAFGSFSKEPSVEDLLRKQMEKQEFLTVDDGGNTDGKPPRGGGRGGGGGNFPDGEGFGEYFDELLQVFLATSALLMLYIYIINGEELGKLAQDYMKYLRTGKASYRVRLARYKWGMFFKSARDKKEDPPDWLEREILATPTWYDGPDKYRRILCPEDEEKASKKRKKASPYREDDYEEEEEEDKDEEQVEEGNEEEEASSYGDEEDHKDEEDVEACSSITT